jgi:hypothetical protein
MNIKGSTLILTFLALLVISLIAIYSMPETPIVDIPQSKRCLELANRRDSGSLWVSLGTTKEEAQKILGKPQNIDSASNVWIWLFDWDEYVQSGLSLDWRTMAKNSGNDGLWIGFDSDGEVITPLWSLSAATPSTWSATHNL